MEGGEKQPDENSHDLPQSDVIALQNFLNESDLGGALYTSEIIDPVLLQFVPRSMWASWKPSSVQSLQESYFSRKNSVSRRFEHKLWNCLQITSVFPNLTRLIGVVWVNPTVFKVYKQSFAKFLSITSIDGGLFHKQGNFTRHGFVDLNEQEAQQITSPDVLADVDYRDVHLMKHSEGYFTANSTEDIISHCKWVDPSPSTRVATISLAHVGEATNLE